MFQERLSHATQRLLQGSQFEVDQLDVEELFKAASSPDGFSNLWIGAALTRQVLQRQREYIQTPVDFVRTLKVPGAAQRYGFLS